MAMTRHTVLCSGIAMVLVMGLAAWVRAQDCGGPAPIAEELICPEGWIFNCEVCGLEDCSACCPEVFQCPIEFMCEDLPPACQKVSLPCAPICAPILCDITTVFTDDCPAPRRIGSIVTFSLDQGLCGYPPEWTFWQICSGAGNVQVLSGSNPGPTFTVKFIAEGSVTVVGKIVFYSTGCVGVTYFSATVATVATCPGDVTGNNVVNIEDLLAVINGWGSPGCGGAQCCFADVNNDGDVDVNDQLAVVSAWGACP